MAGASTLQVIITGDSTKLTSALNQGAASTKSFGKSVSTMSSGAKSALGTAIPLGAAAAGLAVAAFAKKSFDAAVGFDQAFTRIAALTNTTADQIDGMKANVLELAGETAQAPVDLANAMYFLASAGLDAQQQTATLEASAKAAAVGLGQAGDIARITANALNVFADNGLKAADVTDTLVAAVREGSAEPDEFADALGRVLPIADKAGISFQQVAASLATMSNAGLDVNEGVTALRGILQSLVSPTADTQKALTSMGLSVDDVISSLQGNGLISTLRMLDNAARANSSTEGEYNILLRRIVPNVRALTGAMNLTGQEADKVDQIFQNVVNSTGDLDKAFALTAESDSFKLKKAFNDINIAGEELAAKALPTIAMALKLVADHASDLFAILAGYAALRFIQGLFADMAATSVTAAAGAQTLGIASADAAGGIAAEGTAAVLTGGELMTDLAGGSVVASAAADTLAQQSALAATSIETEGTAATATGGKIIALEAGNVAAGASFGVLGAGAGMASGAMKLLNGTLASNLPQIYALVKAFQAANAEVHAFMNNDPRAAVNAITGAMNMFTGIQIPQLVTGDDAQKVQDALDTVNVGLAAASVDVQDKIQIINDALASVGGSVSADNADEFVAAVQRSVSALQADAAAADQAAEAQKKVNDEQQAATESTKKWQQSMEGLTGKLDQLSTIGLDVNGFLSDFRTKLEEADDPQAAFAEGLATIQQKSQEWLDSTSENLTGVGDVLSTLAGKAHLTASDVSSAFQDAAEDARNFASDLATIGETGGQTGADLANALLQMGPSAAGMADMIAGSSGQMRRQMVSDFGKVLSAGQHGAQSLEDVLVPVLSNIETILEALAEKWGIDLNLNDHGASKQVTGLKYQLDNITAQNYNVNVIAHVKGGSPMPDEALEIHLFKPLRRNGARLGAGGWTIPLTVRAHTAGTGELDRALRTQGDSHLRDLAAHIVGTITKAGGTPAEGRGVVRRVAQAGLDTRFIKESTAQVAAELGKAAARRYERELRAIDQLTKDSRAQQREAIHGAMHAYTHTRDAAAEIVRTISKAGATAAEGLGVVKRVAQAGKDTAFIRRSTAQVASELGKEAAHRYRKELMRLDEWTKTGDGHRAAAIKAAQHAVDALTASAQSAGSGGGSSGPTSGTGAGGLGDGDNFREAFRQWKAASDDALKAASDVAGNKKIAAMVTSIKQYTLRTGHYDIKKINALTGILRHSDMTQKEIAAWRKEAKSGFREGLNTEKPPPAWMEHAFKHVPQMPAGHTNIDPNLHNRKRVNIRMDRKHFDDQLAYETDYRGF